MSRFIVTTGSDFRPFSYEELSKPVQRSAEIHAAAADAYDQLSMETEALRNYISENEGDKRAKAMYDNYVNKLNTLQEDLWNRGYTSGTRRGLSEARSAYASDITRLQKAITTRQERSKEYWDARHNHPDLVAGFDPGTGGLDNYLDNSEYGRDWFSYSGKDFMNEVGAEAKARAAELFELYADKSNAPGYLVEIQRQGFTNQQVNDAGELAKEILAGRLSLGDLKDSPEKILAGALVSRMTSTGAKPGENLSASEYDRLFNYGMVGLAQGVGETNKSLKDDKVWDYNMAIAKMDHQAALNEAAAVAKFNREHPATETETERKEGYALDNVAVSSTNQDYAEKEKFYKRNIHNYADNPVLVTWNGKQRALHSEDEANALFKAMGRDDIMNKYHIDPEREIRGRRADNDKRVEFTREMPDGRKVAVRFVPMKSEQKSSFANDGFLDDSDGYKYEPVAVEQRINGKWVLLEDVTRSFNRDNRVYQKNRDSISAIDSKGKKVDLDKLAMVGESKRKIYDKGNISSDVPEQFAQAVYDTKNKQGTYTGAILANGAMPDAVFDSYSKYFAQKYAGETAAAGKKGIDKSSQYAFYELNEGGSGFKKKGDTNASTIFLNDSDGNPKIGFTAIEVIPEDIYNDPIHPKVRAVTNANLVRGFDPGYFGNTVDGVVRAMTSPLSVDNKGIVHYLMLPISDPDRVATMSMPEQEQWLSVARKELGEHWDMTVRFPDGSIKYVGPKQILMDTRNGGLQDDLRKAVTEYMNDQLSLQRDYVNQNGMAVNSRSGSKPTPYIP